MWYLEKFANKDESAFPAPKEAYNSRLIVMALAAATGSAMYGYDSGFIGGTLSLPSFEKRFGLDTAVGNELASLKANIVSTFQAGCFFGAIMAYFCSEKYGRRTTILIFSLVFCVGVVFQVASSGMVGLIYAGRAITGLLVGCMSSLTPIYISEQSIPAIKGLTVGLYECVYQTCLVIAFWVNYGVKVHQPDDSDRQWHIPFALQFIFGGLCFIAMFFQPESYRWLVKAGKVDKARQALVKIRRLPPDHPYINYEIQAVLEQLQHEQLLVSGDIKGNFIQRSDIYLKFKELGKPGLRFRIFLGISVMVWQNLSGINALNYYSPSIFKSIGVSGKDLDLLATGCFGIAKAVTNIIAILFIVDTLGRRIPLMVGSLLTFFTMIYLAIYSQVSGSFDHTVPMDLGARAALACVYLFAVFYAFSWNAYPFIYCSEIFSANIRGFAMLLCVMTQWLMQFVIVYSNPYMMANIKYGTFYFFAGCLLLSVPFVYFLMPETRGISIENMDILFDVKGFARAKRHKTDEIIKLRRAELVIDDFGKTTVNEIEDNDDNLIEKVPTTSTKSVREQDV